MSHRGGTTVDVEETEPVSTLELYGTRHSNKIPSVQMAAILCDYFHDVLAVSLIY